MNKIQFFPHQEQGLKDTEHLNKVAYYWDMGLGKTFVGAEKLIRLNAKINLVVCQKSKVEDWVNHFRQHYQLNVFNLTNKNEFQDFTKYYDRINAIGIVNYELTYRRPELEQLKNFTLLVDESSLIQNEQTKRTKFITRSQPQNIILLSGTPTAGKYEKLITQINLLGWNISEKLFWNHYVDWEWVETEGFWRKKILGYKNVERLKMKLRQHGAVFLKSEEVPEIQLPKEIVNYVRVNPTKEYKKFMRDRIVTINGKELVGDHNFTKRLHARMLCGHYNKEKLEAFRDLVDSTEDRLIVFYNFNEELEALIKMVEDRPLSFLNGTKKDLNNYHNHDDSITFVQYQTGAMGADLQKANKMVFFTLPESCEFFTQSPKRTSRIGQREDRCFYYYLICRGSIEEHILENLKLGRDYTDELFKKYDDQG